MKVLLTAVILLASGCSQAGGLGEILGGVLNAPTAGNQQLSGTVNGVDTRAQVVYITQSNGQNAGFQFDNNTRVSYQNQNYPVTALERGDEVTVQYEQTSNNSYYVSIIQVNRSVSTSGGGTNDDGRVYSLQGNVRSIDRTNGVFTMSMQNGQVVTVTMPYNPRSNDITRFNQLRNGDYVRLQGEQISNSRFELRQFE